MEKLIITKEHIKEADILEEIIAESIPGNRRSFIKKGGLAAAAMAMAGVSLGSPQRVRAADDGRTDVQLLQESYTLEQRASNTYNVLATRLDDKGMPIMKEPVISIATQFKVDHTAHAVRFKEVITQLGGTVPADVVDTTLTQIPTGPNSALGTQAGIMRYALGVEVYAMKLWVDYFMYCENQSAKRVFLDIAPNEGAHVAILRAGLKLLLMVPTDYDNVDPGKAIVPHAFISMDAPIF